MREKVVEATVRALQRAETSLPDWVLQRIEEAAARESHPLARHHLQFMLENVRSPGKGGCPSARTRALQSFMCRWAAT